MLKRAKTDAIHPAPFREIVNAPPQGKRNPCRAIRLAVRFGIKRTKYSFRLLKKTANHAIRFKMTQFKTFHERSINMTRVFLIAIVAAFAFASTASEALCLEISIPSLTAKTGETVQIPLMVDHVDNLAGVKIVMTYDKEILEFRKAGKSKHTSSLMHVVNDRKPGKLVVVMAGAKGVKGKNFPLVNLLFGVKKIPKDNKSTKIEIGEVQMMNDQLKNLQYKIKSNPLKIVANKNPEKKTAGGSEKKKK